MNTAYYEKMLNNVIYMEVLLVVLTAVNRIYQNVTMRRVLIREGAVYLLYDTDEGRTDCYRTRRGLISEDYRKLYDILEKNMVLRFDDVIEAEKIDKT